MVRFPLGPSKRPPRVSALFPGARRAVTTPGPRGGCRRETEMWPRTAQGVPPHTARHVCLGFAIRKHPIKTFVLIKINKRGPHPGMSCLSCAAPHRVGGSHAPRRSSPAETPSAGPSPGSRRGSGGGASRAARTSAAPPVSPPWPPGRRPASEPRSRWSARKGGGSCRKPGRPPGGAPAAVFPLFYRKRDAARRWLGRRAG